MNWLSSASGMSGCAPETSPPSLTGYIDPKHLAFDIDGVVADTMKVFVDLARERYGLRYLTKEHLTCYDLRRCVAAPAHVIDELICLTLDDEHTAKIPAMEGAADVLEQLAERGPLRFVTARVWPESIERWLHALLPQIDRRAITVIATGDPERKHVILQTMAVRHFVEDRLETCHLLARNGIQPILFDQPWNRQPAPFPRVSTWYELAEILQLGRPTASTSKSIVERSSEG
ncbi:5' nucleotidase, NT5C type [Desulfosoma sp.]